MLKPLPDGAFIAGVVQPPLGGCVLKQEAAKRYQCAQTQPPLGGCVLKHNKGLAFDMTPNPAAFRRLCVETGVTGPMVTTVPAQPPLGGCVLKRT